SFDDRRARSKSEYHPEKYTGVASEIRVNAIAPGLIRTPASTPVVDVPEIIKPVMENVLLGQPGEPDEVAAWPCFLPRPAAPSLRARRSMTMAAGVWAASQRAR